MESGWLIEKRTEQGPMWWNGAPRIYSNSSWDNDPDKAIRFAREEDAKRCALAQGYLLSNIFITEHQWE